MTVWETNGEEGEVEVYVNDRLVETKSEVTAQDVKNIASEHGIRKFTVSNGDVELEPEDFPVTSGSVYINEYNEAK